MAQAEQGNGPVRAHHPVLWIDGSEGAWLADVGRVSQHGGKA